MLKYRSDPFGNILILSKYYFSLNTYKLLNKNLNFVPTPKQYSQKQFDADTKTSSVFYNSVPFSKMPMNHKRQTNYINL